MDTRRAFSILLCAAFGLAPRKAGSSPTRPSCVDQLRTSGELENAVWREAVASLRLHLQRLDTSRCGETILYLRSGETTATLEAVTRAGQHALRPVRDPALLIPIAMGLLATIPDEPGERFPPSDDSVAMRREGRRPLAVVASAAPAVVDVDLGLTSGARLNFGPPTLLVDIEGRADIAVKGWIVMASARYAANALVPDDGPTGYSYTEASISAGFGRRVVLGSSLLDVTVAPTIVSVSAAADNPAGGEAEERTAAQTRLAAAVRYSLHGPGGWRFSGIADGDFSPSSMKAPQRLGNSLPTLPRWSLGLRLGVMCDLL
jgi:hypothetical protein